MLSPMETLTGILVDVSGSMEKNLPGGDPNKPWVRSIFQVIDNLIDHDVSPKNNVFTIGFGVSRSPIVFDVLTTIDAVQEYQENIKAGGEGYKEMIPYHKSRVEKIIAIAEENGAKLIRKWVKDVSVVEEALSGDDSAMLLYKLETDHAFLRAFVHDFLPDACRVGVAPNIPVFSFFATRIVATVKQVDKADVDEVVRKAKLFLVPICSVNANSIFTVHKAKAIVKGSVGEEKLTDKRVGELTKSVEPFIYGRTPLFSALSDAVSLFSKQRFKNHKKLLFVLSDGEPTDTDNNNALQTVRRADVTVVCCYITRCSRIDPLRLYDDNTNTQEWEEAAKFMFDLASNVATQSLPRSIFTRRESGHHWTIDFETNETRLFAQVSHPENIRDVCDLSRDVVCSGDALSDMLASVDLDLYINKYSTRYKAQEKQKYGTCYAHASAVVLHLAMKRILGRDGGYPEFSDLRDEMVRQYGSEGANTFAVLQAVCPKYRLRCREVGISGALEAVSANRPVVANFRLTSDEFERYAIFFYGRYTHRNILTTDVVDISRRPPGTRTDALVGHAVVLTSYNSERLRFMDSWGWDFADDGFIQVKNHKVLDMKFFDVFWESSDLSKGEKLHYKEHGPKVANKLWESLKGLRCSTYTCPLCNRLSPVQDFTGNIGKAKCPNCSGEFKGSDSGNVLALNMYLTSIAHSNNAQD